MAAPNLPSAYSKILDKGYTLNSLTAPAFKGKYEVVGGTTKTFKVYSVTAQPLRDYTDRAHVGNTNATTGKGVGSFGYQYLDAENKEQVVTASQDKYFAISIDKADAKFSADGSLDASEQMRAQLNEVIYPTLDTYYLSKLAAAATDEAVTSLTKTNAYEQFLNLTAKQTDQKVPHDGRVAFATPSMFALLKQDSSFILNSEMNTKSRRSGNYGMIDGVTVIEVPTSYLPDKTHMILTHEDAAAAIKYLYDYKQGEFQESSSGFYVNGRIVYEAFVFDKKKGAVHVLKTK